MERAEFFNKSSPDGLLRLDDSLVMSEIAMSERAGRGLFLAFVLFLVYWLVAVPGVWFTLARGGRRRYTWLAFLGCGVVFTILSWGMVEVAAGRPDPYDGEMPEGEGYG